MSFIYVASATTLTRWFTGRRGLASGLASSGIGVGMLGIAPLSRHPVATQGWRTAYFVVVLLVVGLLLVGMVLLLRPARQATDIPHSALRTQWRNIWPVVTSPSFTLVFAGCLLVYLPVYAVLAHLVPFVASTPGLTEATGAWALGAFGVSTGLTRAAIGPVADHHERRKTFLAASVVVTVTVALLPLATDTVAVGLFGVAFGAAYGGNGALLAPVLADMYGTSNINGLFGIISQLFSIPGLVAPPLAGYLYGLVGAYWPAFVGSGLIGILGVGCTHAGILRADQQSSKPSRQG